MKKIVTIVLAAVAMAGFVGCSTISSSGPPTAATGNDPFHVMRTEQLAPLPSGAVVGVISGSPDSPLGLFLGSALDSRDLVVREIDLYSLLPAEQLSRIAPEDRYTFLNTLVAESIGIINETASTTVSDDETGTVGNIDLDSLIDRLYDVDDLVAETQRVGHYLELTTGLRNMIEAMNVDYILVSGAPYAGLSYSVKIYATETLDVVFRNLIVSDEQEWRRIIPAPQVSPNLSFDFTTENEPAPYWDLSYAEYVVSMIEIN